MRPKNRLGYTLEELENRVVAGLMQAHALPKGAVITQIDNYPEERVLHVVLLVGKELNSWDVGVLEKLQKFARENGCKAIEADCRPGMAKFLEKHGFRRTKIKMRNET